jgi:hypothetical protein
MPVTADVKTGVNFVSLLMSKRVSISCQFRVNFVSISCHGILDIPDQKALQYVQSDDNLPFSRPSLPANMQISRLSSVPLQSDYPSPPASPPQRGEQQSTAEQGQSKVRARQEQGRSMAGTPQEQGWPTAEQGQSKAGTAPAPPRSCSSTAPGTAPARPDIAAAAAGIAPGTASTAPAPPSRSYRKRNGR